MRLSLPIAAGLVSAVTIALVHPHLGAASPQDGQKPASALSGIQITGRVVSGDPPAALPRATCAAPSFDALRTDSSGSPAELPSVV